MAPMTGRIAHGTDGAGRDFRKDFPFDQAVFFERAQIIGQHLAADPRNAVFDLCKALRRAKRAALVYAKHTPQCQKNSKTIFELI